jgi:hypothetical protein
MKNKLFLSLALASILGYSEGKTTRNVLRQSTTNEGITAKED